MATRSTVSLLKAALVSNLTTAINDSAVQVVYGRPQDALVRRQVVYVADVDYSASIATMQTGRKSYDENYTVDIVFAVAYPRGAPVDSENRAFALFEALRDLLAEQSGAQGLGVDGVWALTLESVDATTTQGNEGPVTVLVATLRCKARID